MNMKNNKFLYGGLVVFAAVMFGCSGMNEVDAEENKIPEWVKDVFQFYVDGNIDESELINALEFLAQHGIINIEQPKYEKFSKEKFPDTDGYDPNWLKGENQRLKDNCDEENKIGYQSPWCKFVE